MLEEGKNFYKAKIKGSDRWISGEALTKTVGEKNLHYIATKADGIYEVDGNSLCRYVTTSKRGKPIFERDIVMVVGETIYDGESESDEIFEIAEKDGKWILRNVNHWGELSSFISRAVLLGSSLDNPELLPLQTPRTFGLIARKRI